MLDSNFYYLADNQKASSRKELMKNKFFDLEKLYLVNTNSFSNVNFELTFYQAVKKFLTRIVSNNSKLYILYSGGIDSEIFLYVAMMEGYDPIPITVDLFGVNSYDVMWSRRFCKQHGLRQEIFEISELEFQKKWLPEFLYDTECSEFLYSAAYIASRLSPFDGVTVICGDGPNPIVKNNDYYLQSEYEHNQWPQKISKKYNKNLVDPYWDMQILSSFLKYPMISERLDSPNSFSEWYFDTGRLGKEFFYTDHNFHKLKRRFSQHGWEKVSSDIGYKKDMYPSENRLKILPHFSHYVCKTRAAKMAADMMTKGAVDYDYCYDLLFRKTETPILNDYNYYSLALTFFSFLPVPSQLLQINQSTVVSRNGVLKDLSIIRTSNV